MTLVILTVFLVFPLTLLLLYQVMCSTQAPLLSNNRENSPKTPESGNTLLVGSPMCLARVSIVTIRARLPTCNFTRVLILVFYQNMSLNSTPRMSPTSVAEQRTDSSPPVLKCKRNGHSTKHIPKEGNNYYTTLT